MGPHTEFSLSQAIILKHVSDFRKAGFIVLSYLALALLSIYALVIHFSFEVTRGRVSIGTGL